MDTSLVIIAKMAFRPEKVPQHEPRHAGCHNLRYHNKEMNINFVLFWCITGLIKLKLY